jgi:hypothetical protein
VTLTLDAPVLLGKATPRLSTVPLVTGPAGPCGCGCALTEGTSLGFEAIMFAEEVLGVSLIPWQRYWLIHALELRADGKFRFRTVLTLISRQNGKSHLLKVLALYMMYMGRVRLVLGAAQSLDISREVWRDAVAMAQGIPELADEIDQVLRSTVEYSLILANGARYRITAANDRAGRGLSVDLLILDELRTHHDSEAWSALSNTTMARPNALIVGISNAGDDRSVVLNDLRSRALAGSDQTLGLFEWSAPDGCALDDLDAWAQANPSLGHVVSESAIRSSMNTSRPVDFRTENLCQRVDALDAAVDGDAWRSCADPAASLAGVLDRMVMGVDVSLTSGHVTATAAALLDDGSVVGEVFDQWPSVAAARDGLREAFERYRPRAVAWFPSGPATVLGAELQNAHGTLVGADTIDPADMPADAPGIVPLSGQEASSACQTFASLVEGRQFVHKDDPLLNAHIAASVRKDQGDGWRFARRGVADNDAAYAMAGAVHLARKLPPPATYDVLSSVF